MNYFMLEGSKASTMSQPTVLINSFIEQNGNKLQLDPVSKCFMIIKAAFGFNRTSLLTNSRLRLLIIPYSFLICVIFFYITLKLDDGFLNTYYVVLFQYVFCSVCCFVQCDRMRLYYCAMNNFDNLVGCRPAVDRLTILNLLQITCTCIIFVVVMFLPYEFGAGSLLILRILPLRLIYVIELGYYSHLLCLFTPRLKLINYYIESLMFQSKSERQDALKSYVCIKKFGTNINSKKDIKKIMDGYRIIVEAYDHLLYAVKWPLLAIIVSAFIAMLVAYVQLLLQTIHGTKFYLYLTINLSAATANMLPLFGPCVFGDNVRGRVIKLRELLAATLYQNRLDKTGRGVARALLEYTETRDLSFCLLRVLNVDISLPFKFIALLVTYIIIVLQFDKVINP